MKNLYSQLAEAAKKRKKFPVFSSIVLIFKKKRRAVLISSALVLFPAILIVFFSGPPSNSSSGQSALVNGAEERPNYRELFLSPTISHRDYPDFGIIQNNSLAAFAPSYTVEPEALMTIAQPGIHQEPGEIQEYVVEQGDTPSAVAEKFGISLNTVLWANDLSKNSAIKPGQKLIILPVSGTMHLVKSGDTLSRIAEDYGAEIEDIEEFNDLSEEGEIFVGDILIIPGGEMPGRFKADSVPLASSYFIFPCKGKITQHLHWYNAIDVANKCGSAVVAAAEGAVQKAGWSNVGGHYVRILHPNGVVTYYGHLSKILVSPGQKVSQGDWIGNMGATGHATGCHLHFDVRGAGNPLASYSLGSYISWQ